MWEGPQGPDPMSDNGRKIAVLRPLPHSKNLRLHRWADASASFFITKSPHPKRAVLDIKARSRT